MSSRPPHSHDRTRHKIVADPVGNRPKRSHRAGNHNHGVDHVAARGDGRADILIWQNFNFCGRVTENGTQVLPALAFLVGALRRRSARRVIVAFSS